MKIHKIGFTLSILCSLAVIVAFSYWTKPIYDATNDVTLYKLPTTANKRVLFEHRESKTNEKSYIKQIRLLEISNKAILLEVDYYYSKQEKASVSEVKLYTSIDAENFYSQAQPLRYGTNTVPVLISYSGESPELNRLRDKTLLFSFEHYQPKRYIGQLLKQSVALNQAKSELL